MKRPNKPTTAPAPAPKPKLSFLAAQAEKSSLAAEKTAMREKSVLYGEALVRVLLADAPKDDFLAKRWEGELTKVNRAVRATRRASERARSDAKLLTYEDRLADAERITKGDMFTRLTDIASKFQKPKGVSSKAFKAMLKDARDNARPDATPSEILATATATAEALATA